MVSRAGFSLAEVIVSLALLSVAALSLAGSAALAAGLLRSAERDEAAGRFAASLLDSLVLVREPGAGSATSADLLARWSGSAGSEIGLWISYLDAGRPRVHYWSARRLTDLPATREMAGRLP